IENCGHASVEHVQEVSDKNLIRSFSIPSSNHPVIYNFPYTTLFRSRPGRLGGCHEYHHLTGHLALRHHLLLDTATFLGALTAHPEGLRKGAYSYAARGDG